MYLRAYDSVSEACTSIGRYLNFYNGRRSHSSLDRRTPPRQTLHLSTRRFCSDNRNQLWVGSELARKPWKFFERMLDSSSSPSATGLFAIHPARTQSIAFNVKISQSSVGYVRLHGREVSH